MVKSTLPPEILCAVGLEEYQIVVEIGGCLFFGVFFSLLWHMFTPIVARGATK